MTRLLGLLGVLALVVASAALATKPGPGSSSGSAPVPRSVGIRGAIGNVKAVTAILESQFGFSGGTMAALAQRIVATTQSLYGTANANAARAVFHGLGILP